MSQLHYLLSSDVIALAPGQDQFEFEVSSLSTTLRSS